ncbi:MAG: hypothetical protein RPR97_10825 [Colwellia sp.]|jgi:hypothetical protein
MIKRIKWWLLLFKVRVKPLWKDAASPFEYWIIFASLFNHLNIRMKRNLGVFLPFALGVPEDGLKEPVALVTLKEIERRFEPLNLEGSKEPFHYNVILPTINPTLIFGGYIGLFHFVASLLKRGCRIRLLVSEDVVPPMDLLLSQFDSDSIVYQCISRCEIVNAMDRTVATQVGKEDVFIGYSWFTMRLAHQAAISLNEKRAIFFIQEFEPIFHHYDSLRFLAEETYSFPHSAVFNSPQLVNYFESKKIGVFNSKQQGSHCFFKHAISEVKPPNIDEIKQRKQKKILLYARPESHAGRNMFEVTILALKEAIKQNVFELSDWTFFGIGSLEAIKSKLMLADDVELQLLQKMPYSEYISSLNQYDIGISLMYAPHPSVPPLEMASAGMLTITTEFENRTASEMAGISNNILSAEHTMESIVSSIRQAVARVDDYQARCDNANIKWPTSWEQSFNDKFSTEFDTLSQ